MHFTRSGFDDALRYAVKQSTQKSHPIWKSQLPNEKGFYEDDKDAPSSPAKPKTVNSQINQGVYN